MWYNRPMFRKGITGSFCLMLVFLVACGAPERTASERTAPAQAIAPPPPPPPPSPPSSVAEAKAYIGGTDGYYHSLSCPELSARDRQYEPVKTLEDAGYRPCPVCKGKEVSLAGAVTAAGMPSVDFQGKCVGVADGDTISVMHDGREEKIRLFGIDCPEGGQAYGSKAKECTSALVFGKTVGVEVKDRDQYGRTVAVVYGPDGNSVNYAIVAAGFAWWYRHYAPGDRTFERLEAEAKANKRGLWADPNAIPPWDYRQGSVAASSPSPPAASAPPPAASASPVVSGSGEVYIAATGKKYHHRSCRTLKSTSGLTALSKEAAESRGYTPCKVCKP